MDHPKVVRLGWYSVHVSSHAKSLSERKYSNGSAILVAFYPIGCCGGPENKPNLAY